MKMLTLHVSAVHSTDSISIALYPDLRIFPLYCSSVIASLDAGDSSAYEPATSPLISASQRASRRLRTAASFAAAGESLVSPLLDPPICGNDEQAAAKTTTHTAIANVRIARILSQRPI